MANIFFLVFDLFVHVLRSFSKSGSSSFSLSSFLFILLFLDHAFAVVGFPGGSDGKESACIAGDLCLTPGLGRSPGEGNGNPLQYSCLENSKDRGAWWVTVHGFTESDMTEQPHFNFTLLL